MAACPKGSSGILLAINFDLYLKGLMPHLGYADRYLKGCRYTRYIYSRLLNVGTCAWESVFAGVPFSFALGLQDSGTFWLLLRVCMYIYICMCMNK